MGESTTAKLVLKLEEPTAGTLRWEGRALQGLAGDDLRAYRRSVQAVFQDPYASLNPRMRVGDIIVEPLITHERLERRQVDERLRRLLGLVGLVGLPERALTLFPHEFSGGQRQRIAIPRALALEPSWWSWTRRVRPRRVHPRSVLLRDLQARLGLAYLFIAHDLAAVAHMSHVVAVMYLGKIVEISDAKTVATHPRHPYTQALFSAAPPSHPSEVRDEIVLAGEVPSPLAPPAASTRVARSRLSPVRQGLGKTSPRGLRHLRLQKVGRHRAALSHLQPTDTSRETT